MFAVDPHFRPSYAEQFNLTVEHEIAPWAMVVKAAGVGNLGRHLYNTYNANQAVPGCDDTQHPPSAVRDRPESERCQLLHDGWLEQLLRLSADGGQALQQGT